MKKVWKALCVLVLISLLVSSLQCQKQPLEKAHEPVPVYYIGGQELVACAAEYGLSITPVTGEKIKGTHILMVDGNFPVEPAFLIEEILSGVPVIVLGNTGIAKNLFDGQSSPYIADGRTPDGKPIRETAFGYMCYPVGDILFEKIFLTSEENLTEAVRLAYEWAVEDNPDDTGDAQILGPYWSYVTQLDYSSGTGWYPYGVENVTTRYYKLYNDNSGAYDWYNLYCIHESVPGVYNGWPGAWHTAAMYTWVDADYYRPYYYLADYDPHSQCGPRTVNVSVGVTSGVGGAAVTSAMSWNYWIPAELCILDWSNPYQDLASWCHDFIEGCIPAYYASHPYTVKPGACIRVPEGHPFGWREHYGIAYGQVFLCIWFYTGEGWWEIGWNPP